MTVKRAIGVAMCAVLLTGCVGASVRSAKATGADLSAVKVFYVEKFTPDNRGIEKLLSDRLTAMGYRSSHGAAEMAPEPVEAIMTYQDKWFWDMAMYMVQLSVQLRDPKTRMIVAKGESFRPSLHRASPEVMVQEVLAEIFRP